MGGVQSALIPAPLGFEYMSIMGYCTDTLRIIYGSAKEINIVRQSITECWLKGIQKEVATFENIYEFKLKGNPFRSMSCPEEAIACRKMACMILQHLHNAGWEIISSSDLTTEMDHMTWFFHRNPNITSTPYPFICIGLGRNDNLQVINGSSAIHEVIKSSISHVWPKGIQNIKYEDHNMVIKLSGNPWNACGEETVHSRLLVQSIINDLHLKQWVLHTNSNIKNNPDSLFFRYDPSIIPDEKTGGNFALSLNQEDRLRIMGATNSGQIDDVRQVIKTYWSGGIQEEREYAGSWEFKLKGSPWWADGAESVSSRYLILRIFEMFVTRGWMISASIETTRKTKDKSVLLFQRCSPIQVPIFCLSLNESDKIRLINAPLDVIQACKDVVSSKWSKGIEQEEEYAGSHQFKLNGNPWSGDICNYNTDGTHARAMLCFMLQEINSRNWRLLISADVSSKLKDDGDYPIDVHSWYFIYDASLNGSVPKYGIAPSFTEPPSYDTAVTKFE